MSRSRTAVICALLLAAWSAGALDLADGRMKLVLHEGIGRFSLYYLTNPKENTYLPLLPTEDPRTSVLSIVIGNKVYRLGESSDFKESVEKTGRTALFRWISPQLTVTEEFSFLSSQGSALANGLRIDLSIRNNSEQDLAVGIRYLWDTWLGEKGIHFYTDSIPDIARETALTRTDHARFWVSPLSGDPDQVGLQCMLSAEGVTVPDKVLFANWKRLNDAPWAFEASAVRNFNMMPYSVNDSAVCQFYEPEKIARGMERSITLAMGCYNAAGFTLKSESGETDLATVLQQSISGAKDIQDPMISVRADLATVNRLLAELEKKLAADLSWSEEEIALMEAAVRELKERSSRIIGR
jgi:hypothetical protein